MSRSQFNNGSKKMKTYDNNFFVLVLAYFTNLAVHSLADLIIITIYY